MTQRLSVALAIASGMISGGFASFGAARFFDRDGPKAGVASADGKPAEQHQPLQPITGEEERRLRALEAQLLAGQLAEAAQAEADMKTTEQATAEQRKTEQQRAQLELELDPVQGRKRALEAWADQLSRHEAEPEDPAWAPRTASAFKSDLSDLAATQSFEVVRARCKSTTCSAQLKYSDYTSAVQSFTGVIHNTYRTNCATETTLPEPAQGQENQPYELTVLYDCALSREGR